VAKSFDQIAILRDLRRRRKRDNVDVARKIYAEWIFYSTYKRVIYGGVHCTLTIYLYISFDVVVGLLPKKMKEIYVVALLLYCVEAYTDVSETVHKNGATVVFYIICKAEADGQERRDSHVYYIRENRKLLYCTVHRIRGFSAGNERTERKMSSRIFL
jgi:hypothetical protein